MTFSDSDSPVIGIEGLRRHRGEKIVVVGREGKRYLGRLEIDKDGPYLGSLSTQRKVLRIQARSDDLYIPVNGKNGVYMRRYYFFQLL